MRSTHCFQEGETVNKALRRLGGGKSNASASQRWKKQKTKKDDQTEEEKAKAAKDSENFLKLTGMIHLFSFRQLDFDTSVNFESIAKLRACMLLHLLLSGLADELLSCGELEIYQATFEKLAFSIKEAEEKEAAAKTHIPKGTIVKTCKPVSLADMGEPKLCWKPFLPRISLGQQSKEFFQPGVDDDDALDMFAASIDKDGGAGGEGDKTATDASEFQLVDPIIFSGSTCDDG